VKSSVALADDDETLLEERGVLQIGRAPFELFEAALTLSIGQDVLGVPHELAGTVGRDRDRADVVGRHVEVHGGLGGLSRRPYAA